MSTQEKNNFKQNDHDLLIEINTHVGNLRDDVKEIRDNVVEKITVLQETKVNKIDYERDRLDLTKENESRDQKISKVEKATYIGIGIVLAIQFVISVLK